MNSYQPELFIPYFCRHDNRIEYATFKGTMDFREMGEPLIDLYNDAHGNNITEETLHSERYMSRKDLFALLKKEAKK